MLTFYINYESAHWCPSPCRKSFWLIEACTNARGSDFYFDPSQIFSLKAPLSNMTSHIPQNHTHMSHMGFFFFKIIILSTQNDIKAIFEAYSELENVDDTKITPTPKNLIKFHLSGIFLDRKILYMSLFWYEINGSYLN